MKCIPVRNVLPLAFAVSTLALAGGAPAVDLRSPDVTHTWSDGLGAYDCPGKAKWLQAPADGNLLAAQNDETIGFYIDVADDFTGEGGFLDSFGWWGGYWNGSPSPPELFRFCIYARTVDDCPGELLYSELDSDYHETLIGSDSDYCIQLDQIFYKVDGENYSVSIVPTLAFPPQWGWAASPEGNGKQVCMRSEYFSYPDWTPGDIVYGDLLETAFVLFNAGVVSVEEHSWATIKGLYR